MVTLGICVGAFIVLVAIAASTFAWIGAARLLRTLQENQVGLIREVQKTQAEQSERAQANLVSAMEKAHEQLMNSHAAFQAEFAEMQQRLGDMVHIAFTSRHLDDRRVEAQTEAIGDGVLSITGDEEDEAYLDALEAAARAEAESVVDINEEAELLSALHGLGPVGDVS